MKRYAILVAAIVAVAFAAPVLAGHGGKCTADTQTCLNEMTKNMKMKGWLGVEYDKNEAGELVITNVVAESPASKAGFQKGDIMVALNGIQLADEKNKEALHKAKMEMKPGSAVTYTVKRNGESKDVAVTLAPMPESVGYAMIGQHMVEHAVVASAEKTEDAKK